jgi:hypothetical protein
MTILNNLSRATTTGLVALVLSTPSCPATTQQQYTQTPYNSDLAHIQDQLDETQTPQQEYSKSELMYTQEEFDKAFKQPGYDSEILRKSKLIHENPKQAFNYLSEEQKKEVTRLCTSLQTSKEKGKWDFLIEGSYKVNYPFVDFKKPTISDALVIYLHETHLKDYAENN